MPDLEYPARGPLAALRVLEFGGLGPGPYAGTVLRDWGAEVVRVERPGEADTQHLLAAGRPRLVADLKDRDDQEAVLELASTADVVVDPYRPGVTERLGVGPDDCLRRNPALVYARISGWGQTGPRAGAAGHDINFIAETGILASIGSGEAGPVVPLNLVADYGGAMYLLAAVLAAVVERSATGRGQVIDVAMSEAASALALYHHRAMASGRWGDERGSNMFDGSAPFYATYRCADGLYVAIGAIEPQFYAELTATLGIDDPPEQWDREVWPQLRSRLEAIFGTRTRAQWVETFQGIDACLSPVLALSEASRSPQAMARGAFVPGPGGVPEPAPTPRFHGVGTLRSLSDDELLRPRQLLERWSRRPDILGPSR